jgi:aldehyde dehydrogenase (NAD+)
MSSPRLVTKNFINNQFVNSVSGKTFPAMNPATGEKLADVQEADKADVDLAVAAATEAFKTWGKSDGQYRCNLLNKLASLIERDTQELAMIESLNNGKPVAVAAAADLPLTVDCFRYYAGWSTKLQGKTIPISGNYMCMTLHEPVGVCACIIPWNFPLLMLAWKLAPALCCGCTVILKVAEQTPLSALRMAELFVEAGFPPGVVNILAGYGPTAGAALSEHPDVHKVAFTGSTEIGRIILKASASSNLKKVSLELGGKSPMIVLKDANLDKAVELAHFALFFNQGQCCCAGSRVFVEEEIYDAFVAKSAERARKRIVGNPLDAGTEQGPQVDKEQFDKIMGYIESGKSEGARLVCGGSRVGTKGFFVQPTVFADCRDDMKIFREEIFGPVISITKFKTLDEMIARANRTNYGLAAGVLTNNLPRALHLAREIRAGTVWVNCYDVFSAAAPFGGYKESGHGRDLGEYALENWTEVKTVTISLDPNAM